MNNDRRKALRKVAEEITTLLGQLEDCKSELENLRDEEQEYYDNMPESLQGGEKGDAAQEAVIQIDEAIDAIDTLMGEDPSGTIENACA